MCIIAGEKVEQAHQPLDLILIQMNQAKKIKIKALIWVITERSKYCTSRFMTFRSTACFQMFYLIQSYSCVYDTF
jgi:hypothetical protein